MTLVTRFPVGRTRALLGLAYAAPIVVLLALLLGDKKASIDFGVREREGVRYLEPTSEILRRLADSRDASAKHDQSPATLDKLLTHADADWTERAAAAGRAAEVLGERRWTLAASELNDMLESRITALSRSISRLDGVTSPSLPHPPCV